ncbi:MAG TPA: hypothetical protein PKD85_06010 [Saprospiraceae bacterium]|nr:hypothetical protein [Saprospiraceae bacterium]
MRENTVLFILLSLISDIFGTIGGFGPSIFVPLAKMYFRDY